MAALVFRSRKLQALACGASLLGIDHEKKNIFIKIIANAPDSFKKELSHFLADESIGLLEFGEVRLDLEELFKQMIH